VRLFNIFIKDSDYQHQCSVSNATLNRFFSLHYLLPFVLAALAVAHLIAHFVGPLY
jgi:quinol-cytochrome oxidoreductase complex cytochrome b subunit